MILEIDAGNSRIKWRLLEWQGGKAIKHQSGAVVAREKSPSVFIELGQQLELLPMADVSRARVSNVRGSGFQSVCAAWLREKWGLLAEFAQVGARCGGVVNAYQAPESMGVDRWLAMVAAFQEGGGPCCVVDCGSAMTLDFVDVQGVHQGGHILPGLYLMLESLGRKSQALRQDCVLEWQSTALGKDTASAIQQGLLALAVSYLKQSRVDLPADTRWFLTGGDAAIVGSQMGGAYELRADLVMDGLAYVLP